MLEDVLRRAGTASVAAVVGRHVEAWCSSPPRPRFRPDARLLFVMSLGEAQLAFRELTTRTHVHQPVDSGHGGKTRAIKALSQLAKVLVGGNALTRRRRRGRRRRR